MEKIRKGHFAQKLALFLVIITLISASSPFAEAYSEKMLIPMGDAIGITINYSGAVVSNISQTAGGYSPAGNAGIKIGDIIKSVNGCEVSSVDEIKSAVANSNGGEITIKILRSGQEKEFCVVPYCGENGYELGVWLRDSMSGLGTMTFYDPETKTFGALGHGVNENDSKELIAVKSGKIMPAAVNEVTEGRPGFPGQLRGNLSFDKCFGNIKINCANGIFGDITSSDSINSEDRLPTASNSDIKVGKAYILCDVGEGKQKYDVEVSRIYLGSGFEKKNMLITVTDERLIRLTGGIVQGMSGSPIIQDGKLIGAVTHVLINAPQKGYGITIENMLKSVE